MQLSRKRTMVATHLSSSSSNHQPLRRHRRLGQTMKSPDRKLREEHLHHLHLLQHSHAYFSPSDEAYPGDNSTTVPLLWQQEGTQLPVSRSTDKSWSMSSSLLECCPTSPSPVCSPFISRLSNARSYLSDAYSHASNACSCVSHPNTDDDMFLTAASSGLEETEKNRPSLSEIQEINANESNEDPTFESPEFSFSQPNLQPSNRLQTPYRQRYQTQDGRGSNQKILQRTAPARYTSHQQNVHETARLSGAGTISRQRPLPPNTVPSRRSSVTGCNRRSVDGYYLADDENGLRCDPGQFSHSMPGSLRGGQIEARLRALKEERNKKLLTRLWKQEQAIDDWKRKQILKAKEKMRKTEMKLDLERRTAREKAKKDIEKAQNKAEKRKLQEQNETAKKITRSYKAVEKISWVGKILWKLACF